MMGKGAVNREWGGKMMGGAECTGCEEPPWQGRRGGRNRTTIHGGGGEREREREKVRLERISCWIYTFNSFGDVLSAAPPLEPLFAESAAAAIFLPPPPLILA